MPLITFTLLKGKSASAKKDISQAAHQSLVHIGVPTEDLFQRFIELDEDNLIYSPIYPDLKEPRTNNFIIVEVLLSVGRSVKIKRQFLNHLIEKLKALNIAPNDVFVCFKETAWENWAFAGGEILHA